MDHRKKSRKKRSPVWCDLGDEEFISLVGRSETFSEITRFFGLENKGGNISTVKRRIQHLGIDVSHIATGLSANKGKNIPNKSKIPLQEILNGGHPQYQTNHLKKRLFKDGLKREMCELCGLGAMWNGAPISLHLDHINGNSTDHRLVNLRVICPNCHSQTPTYAGRNSKKV